MGRQLVEAVKRSWTRRAEKPMWTNFAVGFLQFAAVILSGIVGALFAVAVADGLPGGALAILEGTAFMVAFDRLVHARALYIGAAAVVAVYVLLTGKRG